MSMTSDLAATSPLLLQLLIPQGFTLQSRPAQTHSQTQAPWLQWDPLLSLLLSPQGPGLWSSHVPILQPLAPGTTPTSIFFPFLITTNRRVKSQTVVLLSRLCVLGPVTV